MIAEFEIVRLQPVVQPPTIGLRAKNLENRTIDASLTCGHFLSWTRRRARRPHAEGKLIDQLISTTTLRFLDADCKQIARTMGVETSYDQSCDCLTMTLEGAGCSQVART